MLSNEIVQINHLYKRNETYSQDMATQYGHQTTCTIYHLSHLKL